MTKSEVVRLRNVLKCGAPVPTTPEELKKIQENRCVKIIFDGFTIDEASSFVMWDDANECIYAVIIGNGTNGGGIIQSAQPYSNKNWKTGGICGENFQVLVAKYDQIFGMISPAVQEDVEDILKYFASTLSGDNKTSFEQAANFFLERHVKPLRDIRTYTDSPIQKSPYPYVEPKYDAATGKWLNPDGSPAKLRPNGEPYPNPKSFFTDESTQR